MIPPRDSLILLSARGAVWVLALALAAGAGWLHAQGAASTGTRNAPAVPAANPAAGGGVSSPATGFAAGSLGLAPATGFRSGASYRADASNQSLFEAFQPGGGLGGFLGAGGNAGFLAPSVRFSGAPRPASAFAGGVPPAAPKFTLTSLSQFNRQGAYLHFNSTAGGFQFSWGGPGGRGNALGRMRPGAPLASYTTPNLGSSLVNFSAATYMGGTGYGAQKRTGPSISLRLNF